MDGYLNLPIGQSSYKGQRGPFNADVVSSFRPPDPRWRAAKGTLFALADGMGSHSVSQQVAQSAVHYLINTYYADPSPYPAQSLERAMRAANGWLYAWAHQYPAYRDLGSTLVAAVVRESQAVVANVGDSRAYLVRNGYPWLITRDHRWVAQEVAAGSLSWEQAQRHSWRKVLTQAIGTRPEVAVDVFQVALQPGDALVLCTDGLWERVRGQEIAAIVGRYPPGEAARHLATLARARGEQDDITALVVNWVATRPLAATYSPYPGYRQPAYAPTSAGLRTLAPGLARDGRLLAILLSLLAIYFVTALVILAAARGW